MKKTGRTYGDLFTEMFIIAQFTKRLDLAILGNKKLLESFESDYLIEFNTLKAKIGRRLDPEEKMQILNKEKEEVLNILESEKIALKIENYNKGNYELLTDLKYKHFQLKTKAEIVGLSESGLIKFEEEIYSRITSPEKITLTLPSPDGSNFIDMNMEVSQDVVDLQKKAISDFYENSLCKTEIYDILQIYSLELYFDALKNLEVELVRISSPNISETEKHELYGLEKNHSEIYDLTNGINCPEYNILFSDINSRNIVWQYMIDLKMIDFNGNYLLGQNRSYLYAFIVVMKKHSKIPPNTIKPLIKAFTLKLFNKNIRINESFESKDYIFQIENRLFSN